MKGKTYLWILMVVMLIASMAMVNVPVSASPSPETRVYVEMPIEGYINGTEIGAGNSFTVDVYIENATDMVQWALSVEVDPNVLNVSGVEDDAGTVIYDYVEWCHDNWITTVGEVFYVDSVNPAEGTIINATHAISSWPNLYTEKGLLPEPPGGFNGSGKLCTLNFTVLDETAYSPIHLYDVLLFDGLYWETGDSHYLPPDIVEDGQYNVPPVMLHDVAVTAVTAPAEATQPDDVTVDVDLANEGYFDETVELKVSIDGIEFFAKELTLLAGASVKESASLDTIIVGAVSDPTNYTITAEAEIVVDEDPADNWKEKLILINPGPVGCIMGTVTDAGTSDPIEGAIVQANGYSTFTDADGYYQIMGVPPENYTVTASKDGYATASELEVSVAAGTNVIVDFALQSLFYRVDLVKRSAWPEHHSFSIGGDEDGVVNLYAIIKNVGDRATDGKVVFNITTAVGLPSFTVETSSQPLEPEAQHGNLKDYFAQWTPTDIGIWYVTAKAWYKDDEGVWQESPDKPKTFKFTVKP